MRKAPLHYSDCKTAIQNGKNSYGTLIQYYCGACSISKVVSETKLHSFTRKSVVYVPPNKGQVLWETQIKPNLAASCNFLNHNSILTVALDFFLMFVAYQNL